jgi:hypothetical protein
VRSHTVNVIARSVATRQSQPFFKRLPRSLRLPAMTIYCKRLPRPFRARNDIVKIYIAFVLICINQHKSIFLHLNLPPSLGKSGHPIFFPGRQYLDKNIKYYKGKD